MESQEQKEYREGQEAFHEGKTYTDLQGSMSAKYRGWDAESRVTRCGYSLQHWNKAGDGYKTSSDISTLF
jgi:hypothetical protein